MAQGARHQDFLPRTCRHRCRTTSSSVLPTRSHPYYSGAPWASLVAACCIQGVSFSQAAPPFLGNWDQVEVVALCGAPRSAVAVADQSLVEVEVALGSHWDFLEVEVWKVVTVVAFCGGLHARSAVAVAEVEEVETEAAEVETSASTASVAAAQVPQMPKCFLGCFG